jgi:hypothetical protein
MRQATRARIVVRRAPREMEKRIMTKFKMACAATFASMLIAAPAFAQDAMAFGNGSPYDSYAYTGPAQVVHHGRAVSRSTATSSEVAAPAYGFDGPACIPAPRVGAFATQPWDTQTPCEPNY